MPCGWKKNIGCGWIFLVSTSQIGGFLSRVSIEKNLWNHRSLVRVVETGPFHQAAKPWSHQYFRSRVGTICGGLFPCNMEQLKRPEVSEKLRLFQHTPSAIPLANYEKNQSFGKNLGVWSKGVLKQPLRKLSEPNLHFWGVCSPFAFVCVRHSIL